MFFRARTQISRRAKSKSPNPIKRKKITNNLPDNLSEKILDAEMKLKINFSMEILQELINYYRIAIEYYKSKNDLRYKRYSTSLNLLLSNPDVLKNISMQTNKGKIKVLKEERKKFVLNEIEKIDKNIINNKEVEKIIVSENEIKEKEKKAFHLINDNLNEQGNNFKKRLEAKRKKINLNECRITNLDNNKNKKKENHNKISLNKSFDMIDKDENIFGDDINIEPINKINNNNNKDLTELINTNIQFFFSEFNSIFSEKILQKFINEVNIIENEKHNELINISEKYASLIKENECKLTLSENDTIEKKLEIDNLINKFGVEESEKKKLVEKKYKEKLNELKQNMKNKVIKNLDWIHNIKEKYVNNIEDIIHNYYQ